MSGGAVTSGSKVRGGNPEGAETSGGERVDVSLNRRSATTNRWSEQRLEVDRVGAGAGGATLRQARTRNGKKAPAGDELVGLISGKNPWRGNLGRGSRMKQAGKV
jgi:hypothetical protein